MKKILIAGANSYIGTSFEGYIKKNYPNEYTVDTVDTVSGKWREKSFRGYDGVFCVAGIAHIKETKENSRLYYEVNRDLVIELARKAKADGVRHFVFLSSMSVYGKDTGIITKETAPFPKSHYGRSKLEAEKVILPLADESFLVCVLRPPMVYGKDCKGNFQKIVKMVKRLPFFPNVKNERSMIYIDNLSCFVRLAFDRELSGVYFPQNREYMCTADMARYVASALKKRIFFDFLTGLAVLMLLPFYKTARKAFGSLVYKNTEDFDFSYELYGNEESIRKSVE